MMEKLLNTYKKIILFLFDKISPILAIIISKLVWWRWTSNIAKFTLLKTRIKSPKEFLSYLWRFKDFPMEPSRWWVALIIVVGIIFGPQILFFLDLIDLFGLEVLFRNLPESPFNLREILLASWQVMAAVIALSLTITVFLVGFVQERAYETRVFPTFIKHTKLTIVSTFGLLTLISIGINVLIIDNPAIPQKNVASISGFNFLLLLFNLILISFLYLRTFQFISPTFFRYISLRQNREAVAKSVDEELSNRLGNQIVKAHCDRVGIEYSILSLESDGGHEIVNLKVMDNQIWQVSDVNLSLLSLASWRARALNPSTQIKFNGYPRFSRVSREQPGIASLPGEIYRPQVSQFIEHAVRVLPLSSAKKRGQDSNLNISRDLLLEAIRGGRVEVVEELLHQYLQILQEFLNAFNNYGLAYTPENAKEQSGFSDWKLLTAVQRQISSLIEQVYKSGDEEIIYEFTGFPIRVMALAHRNGDHLIYQKFSSLYPYFYQKAKEIDLSLINSQSMFQRHWSLLADYYQILFQSLQKPNVTLEDAMNYRGYVEALLGTMNRLLKHIIDFRDLQHFIDSSLAIRSIGSWIGTDPRNGLERLKLQFSRTESEELRKELARQIEETEIPVKEVNRIKLSRGVLFLGLGGWLVHLLELNQISVEEFSKFVNEVNKEFGSLADLYSSYSQYHSNEVGYEKLFSWSWWELDEKPKSYGNMEFSMMQYSDWISRYYTFRAIQLTPINIYQAQKLQPTSAIRGIRDTVIKCVEYFNTSDIWNTDGIEINSETNKKRAVVLMEMNQQTFVRQKLLEEEELILQLLDEGLVRDFGVDLAESWNENATTRNLYKFYGLYEDNPTFSPEDIKEFGTEDLAPKGAFIKQNRVYYGGLGKDYGRYLAEGEDKDFVAMLQDLQVIEGKLDDFNDMLAGVKRDLQASITAPVYLISSGIQRHFYDLENFIPEWQYQDELPSISSLIGVYEGNMVLSLPELRSGEIAILDLNRLGKWVQYPPSNEGGFPLSITVKNIDQESAEDLFNRHRGLALDRETQEELEKKQALRYFKQRVFVEVWERYQIECIDLSTGVMIRLNSNEE